jgi:NAD(P)-dependent dehydrogenase (short-subunit alcohol dehydrogenase family)
MFFDLTGQTAIVTGAATGIGEAIARRLARAGATVAVADIDVEGAARVAESLGGQCFPLPIDITQGDSVERAVAEVIARTGRIDVLVNNAGVAGRAAPLWEQTEEDWRQIISINLDGPRPGCRRATVSYPASRTC